MMINQAVSLVWSKLEVGEIEKRFSSNVPPLAPPYYMHCLSGGNATLVLVFALVLMI